MILNIPVYYAQNIQTGNASAQSTVVNNVQGNGSVSTHIEVEANGEKKVLDSNSPGTYRLQVQSNSSDQTTTKTPTVSPSPTRLSLNTKDKTSTAVEKQKNHNSSFFSSFTEHLRNFFKQIFQIFKKQ